MGVEPTTYDSIAKVDGLQTFDPAFLAGPENDGKVDKCGERDAVGKDSRCRAISALFPKDCGMDRAVCRMCVAHGEADFAANPYLTMLALQQAHVRAVREFAEGGAREITEEDLDASIVAVKALSGADLAKRLVDAMYAWRTEYKTATGLGVVDADKAVDLIEKFNLVADTPNDEPRNQTANA